MNRIIATLALCGCATGVLATADDLGNLVLFGTEYNVRRVSFNEQVQYEEPVFGGFTFELTACEGIHYIGDNRLLLSTDSGADFGSAKDQVVEVEMLEDADGKFDGLQFTRFVVVEDENIPFGNGLKPDPTGLTINTGTDGFNPGGLVNSSGKEKAWGYDLNGFNVLLAGPVDLDPPNSDSEDIEYVPAVDQFFTVSQDTPYSIIRFDDDLVAIDAHGDIPVGVDGSQSGGTGDPKGIFNIPDVATAPADLQGLGGVVAVVLDDTGPGLDIYQYDGTPAGYESLTDGAGVSLLDFTATCLAVDPFQLQLESGSFDAETGRIILCNQGDVNICGFIFVLEPVDGGCNAADIAEPFGLLDLADISAFVTGFTGMDPAADIAEPFGVFDLADITAFISAFNAGCP